MRSQRGGWAGGVGEPADLPLSLSLYLSFVRAHERKGLARPHRNRNIGAPATPRTLISRLVSFHFVSSRSYRAFPRRGA